MFNMFVRSILLFLGGVFFFAPPAFAFDFNVDGGVKNVHLQDGTYVTLLDVEVKTDEPSEPNDFTTVVFSGPSGVIATFYPDNDPANETTVPASLSVEMEELTDVDGAYLWLSVPGQPALGTYTIAVTSTVANGGITKTVTDTQTVIREIPRADDSLFAPQESAILSAKSPEFSWSLLSYDTVPLYYRFELYDSSDTVIHKSSRTLNMSSYVTPQGILQPGESYYWRLRVTDSDEWVSVENRSNSSFQPFTMASTLGPKPALDLDGWGVVTHTTANGTGFDVWLKIIDHGGVNSTCYSVTVQPPIGDPQSLAYDYDNGSTEIYFGTWVEGGSSPASYAGDWTFTAEDCVGNSVALVDNLTVTPLPLPDESSFVPADGATLVNTTPDFSWPAPSGTNADKVKRARVRVYNADLSQTIWKGYVGTETSYTMPPGVLEPGTTYRYRIDFYDNHSNFETDNFSRSPADSEDYFTFTTGSESPDPYIYLDNGGVSTWNRGFWGPSLNFWINVYDPQGVPGNIKSVTVLLPDATEVPLHLNYTDSDSSGFYTSDIFPTTFSSGSYTFKVEDNEGNTFQTTETFVSDPLGYPAETSLLPLRSTVLGSTAVDFDWEDVAGTAFYRVEIYDEYSNRIHRLATTTSNFSLPEGFLEEGKYYSYRITSRREFFDENVDNGSQTPGYRDNRFDFITTALTGSALPTISTDNWGAVLWHNPRPDSPAISNYWMAFSVKVTDADGPPHSIQKVEVTCPDGTTFPGGDTTRVLGFDGANGTDGWYWYMEDMADATDMPEGTYTFTVTDVDGNSSTATDDFVRNVMPQPTNVLPAAGSEVGGISTPITVSWDAVPGAAIYRVEFYTESGSRFHRPYITETSYTVPAGILDPGTTYSYRVRAHREDPQTTEMDNMSSTMWWDSLRPYITTASVLDSDGDSIPDTIELGHACLDPDDADTDDDGINDGAEDADQDGVAGSDETNACMADTDGDGIQDGTESGVTTADVGADTDLNVFVSDEDNSSTTNPLLADSDGDGVSDGEEDLNFNGRVDEGEKDPNVKNSRAMPYLMLLLKDKE